MFEEGKMWNGTKGESIILKKKELRSPFISSAMASTHVHPSRIYMCASATTTAGFVL
jgi:hypothetical protein